MGSALRPLVAEVMATFDEERSDPHAGLTLRLDMAAAAVTCRGRPDRAGDRRDGWVVLVDSTDPPHEHDLAEHRVVVEQAATIIGTELLRVRSVERAEERARGNFVHALLHGRFSTHADLVARASFHDFPTERRYAVVVARSAGLIADGDSPTRLADMAREAGRIQVVTDAPTLAAVVGDVIGVVRPIAPLARSRARRPPGPAARLRGRARATPEQDDPAAGHRRVRSSGPGGRGQ